MEYIKAQRTYSPGDLIYQDDIFAKVLEREKKDKKCEFCRKSSEDLIYCSDCIDVKYCNSECQSKDAADHKMECGKLDKLRGDALEDVVRLLARVIFKIKGKSWHEIRRDILGSSVSFEDVDSNYEEISNNQRLLLMCSGLKDALKDFIGEENMPTDEDLMKIIGKVKFSSLHLTIYMPHAFCLGVDKFQHECIPNSNIEVCGNIVKIWAIKKIEKDEKITISRIKLLTSNLMRSPLTDDSLQVCNCTECSLSYGESILTKVIDKTKAYDAIRTAERAIYVSQTLSNLDLEDDFRLRLLVDKALEKQVGVLGPTNALNLKLLAIKGMTLQGTDIQKKMYLIELERNMSMAFGELYLELRDVCQSILALNFKFDTNLDNILEGAKYLNKLDKIKAREDEEETE